MRENKLPVDYLDAEAQDGPIGVYPGKLSAENQGDLYR